MTNIIIAGTLSFLVVIFLTPVLIKRFSAEGLGQEIREDGPQSHLRKRGTPTMGGIAILLGIVFGYFGSAGYAIMTKTGGVTATGLLVLGLTVGLGFLGFLDDAIKLFRNRNLGLNKTAKLVGQLVIAVAFATAILLFPDRNGVTPGSTHLSFIRDIATLDLTFGKKWGYILFGVFIILLIAAWSNAVNLTDGLDGLAAGSTAMVMGVYTLITFWQYRYSCYNTVDPSCYVVRDPLDLSILAAAGLGACIGFLWWNAAPAKIFMGDTGSLALGGLVAGLSVASRTELLMVIVGALFVIEALSVIIQVIVFRSTGRRFFRMAPIHHHFENAGWAETTVTIRFWLIAALTAALGLAVFYGDWLSHVDIQVGR
ncbi:phospho-N-acetylmuramoyl-pentapeptide-transferase [Corynebacterium caspium]|uniref:phospho-N-acetylmuramoyl-pentapeptide- transferase n=1 Tax=Corynebacterium caspium TaxID=234828 RepID=UPI0003658DD7|nr:phospho-N-acetylmuramoyl-pentapeptide-transferase [Corynebacterium caspium]WKD58993.1 Phospho-N-acetylmuramoyl-pentapeptide-transferase [Corynebacterium caspium DSM 44850]